MNFRDRNYMIPSSSTESLKGAAFLAKMLGILRGKRVPTPHAELVTVVEQAISPTTSTFLEDHLRLRIGVSSAMAARTGSKYSRRNAILPRAARRNST